MQDNSAMYGNHSIYTPPHSGNDGYVSVYEGETDGLLCSASGRVSAAGYTPYESVYLINRLHSAPRPTDDEFCHVGDEYNGQQIDGVIVPIEEDGSWAWEGPTGPNGGELPAWVGQQNRLWAAAEMMSDDYELELFVGQSTYTGVEHDCSGLTGAMTAAAKVGDAAPPAAMRNLLAVGVQPTSVCDGWLEYRHLQAHSPPFGHLLMLGATPLTASLLAVAAVDTCWYYGNGPWRRIARPMGLLTDEPGGWWFGKAPPAALVLTQGRLAHKEVVVSQSRETHDVFSFDPTRFIFAKINCPTGGVACGGTYSLWVKRIA